MTKTEVKSDYWEIEVIIVQRRRYVFTEPVTEEEAADAVIDGTYEDIVDEEDLYISNVCNLEPLS